MQHILTNHTLTVVHHGRPASLHRQEAGESRWAQAIEALKANDADTVVDLIDTAAALQTTYAGTKLSVVNGAILYGDRALDLYPALKAVEFMREGLPTEALLRFIEHLLDNPSYRAVQDLYKFLEYKQMPISDDGTFLAYKKVRRHGDNLVAIADPSFINDVGSIVEMPRNTVDEDPTRTCSRGLHVCAYDYLPCFGNGPWDTVVAVRVNPADVVAIPTDYDNAKMRVARYEVIEEIPDYRETGHIWAGQAFVTYQAGLAFDTDGDEDLEDYMSEELEEDEDYPETAPYVGGP